MDNISCVECAGCDVGAWAVYGPTLAASPQDVRRARSDVRSFAANKTIIKMGDESGEVLTLYSGWAARYVRLRDGRRQILTFHLPGDSIGLEHVVRQAQPLRYAVGALTPVVVCVFQRDPLRSLLLSNETQRAHLANVFGGYSGLTERRLVDIGRRSAIGRLANVLLELESRLRERGMSVSGAFDFPVRQDDLADALGLTPVHVNRTMMALRRGGVIEVSRGALRIADFAKLRKIAEDE